MGWRQAQRGLPEQNSSGGVAGSGIAAASYAPSDLKLQLYGHRVRALLQVYRAAIRDTVAEGPA